MISELIIDKRKLAADSCRFQRASRIDAIRSMRFLPGLTIVMGPNGSGKSTLLSMLAAGCLAEETGYPTLSQHALREMYDFDGHDRLAGLTVKHNGQVLYADSRRTSRSIGAAKIDDGVVSSVIENVRTRRNASLSHGEVSLSNTNMAMQQMAQITTPDQFVDPTILLEKRLARFKTSPDEQRVAEIRKEIIAHVRSMGMSIYRLFPSAKSLLDNSCLNNVYARRLADARMRFEPSIPLGRQTILLDEPEANLSLLLQARLWMLIQHPKVRETFQIIVASHSLFAIRAIEQLGDAVQVVEMEPGFVAQVRAEINGLNTPQ